MGTSPRNEIINHLRRAVLRRDGAGLTDSQLLECYVLQREEAAFAALVHRHGPMVWGVCHRLLHHHQDTEDAFQATFLVLVRKASTLASRELLANWLYGVAYRTACKARGMIFKRRLRERQVTQMPEPKGLQNQTWPDLEPLLDEELSRLPDKYRIPIILCDLEGKTRKEAARHVGCPEGTLAARLARARAMLARKLAHRGLALSAGTVAALLSEKATAAQVPASVLSSTIKAASLFAAGPAATMEAISAPVAALTEGVLKAMVLTKLKTAVGVMVVATLASIGVGLLTLPVLWAGSGEVAITKDRPPASEDHGRVEGAVDSQQVTKVYPLKHAVAEQVVGLLQSLFIVVNRQEPYARFSADKTTNSLIVGASGQHQKQIARILALVDTPNQGPAQAVDRDQQEPIVKGYRIKQAEGEAVAAVLRSLFLVVNHRVAYARFAYDARTHLLIAIASEKHQKQIARVLELLDRQATAAKEGAVEDGAEQQIRIVPIKHINGEELIAKLRAQFVVVDHEKAQVRFGFEERTNSLFIIATEKVFMKIRDMIAVLDQPTVGHGNECFSTRQGHTITLHPETATFQLNGIMMNWFAGFKNNLHLTREELAKVEKGAGDWDTEYGMVCNAVLPFSRCCAHVGEEGWGKDGVSFADLQVRVYVLEKKIEEVGKQIEERGTAIVKEITKKPPKLTTDGKAAWKRWDFAYDRWYEDYGGTAHVDFRRGHSMGTPWSLSSCTPPTFRRKRRFARCWSLSYGKAKAARNPLAAMQPESPLHCNQQRSACKRQGARRWETHRVSPWRWKSRIPTRKSC